MGNNKQQFIIFYLVFFFGMKCEQTPTEFEFYELLELYQGWLVSIGVSE